MNMLTPKYSLLALALGFLTLNAGHAQPNIAALDSKRIKISTSRSALTLLVGADGRLYQLGYGSADREVAVTTNQPVREMEFYPPFGSGYVYEPALQATHADGNTSTELNYVKHESRSVDPNVTLTRIELKDPAYPFFVTLCFKAHAAEDIIEQWAEIRHEEKSPVTLYRYASAAPRVQGREYWLTQFHGDYKREATLAEEKLTPGVKTLDSKIGVRAHQFRIPSFLVSVDGAANEERGEVIGGSLKWPGSFQFAFDIDSRNRLRAVCGINPFASQYHLKPGQTFVTPGVLWTWSNQGKGQVSRNFHRWALRYGVRDGDKPRPTLLNNWEATGVRFNDELIISLFDGAREIGVETFLLDDGWFGSKHPRNDDKAGLGDWHPDPKKLPRGLGHLATEAKNHGVNFGIWIEPEMVNPRSELFEKHPDWVLRQPERKLDDDRGARFQLILDLGRPEVRDYAWKVIDDTLSVPGVSYTKWDANRFVRQYGSPYLSASEQSHLQVDYNFALLDIMARMTKKFPNVMAMVCAGGGGRVDYGSMQNFHSFWPSDNTDPVARVRIQWGFSHFFPAATMSAHVTRMGNRPLKFASDVALSGAYGVDMDVRRVPAESRKQLAATSALYKERLRPLVQQGDLYRLESPYDHPRAALNYVSVNRDQAVLFVYQLRDSNSGPVKPRGLDQQKRYRVREINLPEGAKSQLAVDGQTVEGETLMRDGLVPPCQKELDSAVIELVAE